jgi:glycosyltransferase involved in cell wall biosynthesis
LIVPSVWYETFGRVAVEAFATGTPVIAAEIGAVKEIVEHGRTGFNFRPGNPQDLIAKVEKALADRDRLLMMRQEARAEFESKYTAAHNYQQLMEIYELARFS